MMKSNIQSVHSYLFQIQSEINYLVIKKSHLGEFSGLFTNSFVPEGDIVCIYTGISLNTQQAMRCDDKSYLMRLGEQSYVDAKPCPHVYARYINDCVNPAGHNVKFNKNPSEGIAYVVALRDINPNEEIFADYGRWYWLRKTPTKLTFKQIMKLRSESDV